MYPCTKELSQTVAVCHRIAVISFKYLAGAKSRKPYIYNVANGIPSVRNDVCVCYPKKQKKCIVFTQNTREEVRDLCDVAGCVSAESGSHQTTYVAVRKRGLCDAD